MYLYIFRTWQPKWSDRYSFTWRIICHIGLCKQKFAKQEKYCRNKIRFHRVTINANVVKEPLFQKLSKHLFLCFKSNSKVPNQNAFETKLKIPILKFDFPNMIDSIADRSPKLFSAFSLSVQIKILCRRSVVRNTKIVDLHKVVVATSL